ncbi:MAG: T9SS type A sorting domain-containing protein, partial [Bacteroidetes bacterium]|nr:T9SS type A sorting domain-containing protein [Bacteroidota bacterium]
SDSSTLLNQVNLQEQINLRFSVHDSIVKCISTRGRLFVSNDWGAHWSVFPTPYTLSVVPLVMVDFQDNMMHGLIWGHDFHIYETLDGGITWTQITTTVVSNTSRIYWIPGTTNTCICTSASFYDSCYYSTNGGHTWVDIPELFGLGLCASGWFNEHIGWVSEITKGATPSLTGMYRFDGTFVHVPWIEDKQVSIQVFPNPCSQSLSFSTKGLLGQLVTINLLNSIGQNMLNNNFLLTQNQENKSVDVSFLAPGIYLAIFNTKDQCFQVKVVIQ